MATRAPVDQTRVSSKGQVVLPAAIRARRRWDAGTRLTVEETAEGVLLRAVSSLGSPKTVDEVAGMLKYSGPTVTLEEMDAAIVEEVERRHARGRY